VSKRLLPITDARARLLQGVDPLGTECVKLGASAGRVLAEPLRAVRAQPPVAMSAMDGYAVRSEDVAEPGASLTVVGEAPAGTAYAGRLKPGEAVRIFTGGPVPEGGDRIVIQEEVERAGETIRVGPAQTGESYIRPAGLDFDAGTVLVEAGTRLRPADVALAANANLAELRVVRRPRVAVFGSGDELVEPGSALSPTSVILSGNYGVAALVEAWGGQVERRGVLPDTLEDSQARLGEALKTADVIITIGGASVGDRDVVKPAARALGYEVVFEKIDLKPGKPTWHARMAEAPYIVGLPGNPASAMVAAHLFAKPLLFALMGRDPNTATTPVTARLSHALPAGGARHVYHRGHLQSDHEGVLRARVDPREDSSLLTPFGSANALIHQPAHAKAMPAGSLVEALWLDAV
jgi:molybdopterin molybdotransferase